MSIEKCSDEGSVPVTWRLSISGGMRMTETGAVRPRYGADKGYAHGTHSKEPTMKPSAKDQVEGTLHEMKGKLKAAVGRASNTPDLTLKGETEALAGKVQKKVGQVKKVFEK
jgi:uncharacterized protein YjbJ (UPF0337 family)